MARPPPSSPVLCLLDGDPSAGWRKWEEHRAVGKTGLCAPFGEASGTGGVLPLPSLVSGELREGRDLVAVALVSPRREQPHSVSQRPSERPAQRARYWCFLAWWEIFPHLPPNRGNRRWWRSTSGRRRRSRKTGWNGRGRGCKGGMRRKRARKKGR